MIHTRSALSAAAVVARQVVRTAGTTRSVQVPNNLGLPILTGRNAPTPGALRNFFFGREKKAADGLYDLKELVRQNPEELIRLYETGKIPPSEANLAEYVKALVKVDRLDGSQMMATLQQGQQAIMGRGMPNIPAAAAAPLAQQAPASNNIVYVPMPTAMPSPSAAPMGSMGSGPLAVGAAAALGSDTNPIYTKEVEPTFQSQIWKTLRSFAGMFMLASVLMAAWDNMPPSSGGGIGSSLLGKQKTPQPVSVTDTKFSDVKGCDEALHELEEIVEYLKNPEKFTKLGAKLPKGVLLVGPPGTGKTMMARAIAGEAGVPFFYASGSEFEEMFVGVGASRVRALFEAAKKNAPCIVFIDEIDAIGGKRSGRSESYSRMTLNQLLVELDGFKKNNGVVIMAATNLFSSLDKALVRPGRFDHHVAVNLPDTKGRREILESYMKKVARVPGLSADAVARLTSGMAGADLANIINVAALRAATIGKAAVDEEILEWARDRVIMGAERKSALITPENKKKTAYHEGGHALVALHTKAARPVYKATVMPRGFALGVVWQLPEKDQSSWSYEQMLASLDVSMGGRVAEELIFGKEKITSGASSDLENATSIATSMVEKWGFSTEKGLLVLKDNQSGHTRKQVEEEVQKMLDASYKRATAILTKHKDELELLAQKLIECETLSGDQIDELLGRKPDPRRHDD
mmetsp:Transcript_34495/g.41696  ORF Transcript_34495/g.41696 Transcript_34495/m.41696 type:complete len:692 (-) Transcript_34495:365-2440(-)|eukprot:CAMPEP_0197857086 /NCGR_PEP_ID=MMETSP1438-20131217/29847_1 /TAXON_ID=1461541 /ORGANISM="Pterosperma sp., Strain CCMP1384" /LENGTH=691 /DNA_ID=CAMNT_0043472783 /DNA_START=123 /DNA_END=2198 /DNA_ORIENTATION=+